jgi:hypothetical protein
MPEDRFGVLRGFLTVDSRIEAKQKELQALTEEKARDEETIRKLMSSDDRRWKVVYFHFVKGMSLRRCASKFHYSKQGVCKIIRTYRNKLK